MAKLSSDIQELINQVKSLKRKAPNDEKLAEQYDELVELQERTQDSEWNANLQEYLEAKAELEGALAETNKKLQELSKVATTIEKMASVTAKLAKAIAAVAAIV